MYHVSLGQFHTKTIELHRKYGKLVRIAPNVVDVGDPTMIPVIYNNRGNFRKVAILSFYMASECLTCIDTVLSLVRYSVERKTPTKSFFGNKRGST